MARRGRSDRGECRGNEGLLARTGIRKCGRSAAHDVGLLPRRTGPEVDGGLGRIDRACRYLQCGAALSPATVRRLVGRAGGTRAGRCRASGEPGSIDPHNRCHNRAEGGNARQDEKPVVACPWCIRSAQRTLRVLRADGREGQPDRIATVLDAGAGILVRAGWKNARWLDANGKPADLLAGFRKGAAHGLIDRPIWIARKSGPALGLRLIAVKKPAQALEAARRKARQAARKGGHQISKGTLAAAEWVILVTSLKPEAFSTADVLALYRLRWRIELGFKRLKSLVGLKGPPGTHERSARPYVLAHLLVILLLEPLIDEFEDSPRLLAAA